MLSRLCIGVKDQFVVVRAEWYLQILVQLDFEFPRIYMVELHQGPVVGLVGTIWKHALIFHLQLHAVKLYPVAAPNICCYIFRMMNIFNFFFKPIEIKELDNWPVVEILKLKGKLLDDMKTIYLPKDKTSRKVQLEHMVADRLKWIIGCNNHVDASGICVDVDCAGFITVYNKNFNQAVEQFSSENKVLRAGADWCETNIIDERLKYRFSFDASQCSDSISEMARYIIEQLGYYHESFNRLKQVIYEYQWAIPVVDHIRVIDRCNDSSVPTWEVVSFGITPECLDGFMTEAGRILQDDEAVAAWRNNIIDNFRRTANNNPDCVDFDRPCITVSQPEEWKTDYYKHIKPNLERRDRAKDVIEEIRNAMPGIASLRDLKLSELIARLPPESLPGYELAYQTRFRRPRIP